MGVVWHGVREFEQSIARIDDRAKVAGKSASLTAGRELAAATAQAAPKGATGKLSKSIEVAATAAVVKVGPTIIYGRRVDIGFKGRKSPRGVRKRRAAGLYTGRRGLQPTKGSHFLEHALAVSRDRIHEAYRRAWATAITKS